MSVIKEVPEEDYSGITIGTVRYSGSQLSQRLLSRPRNSSIISIAPLMRSNYLMMPAID
jgi:hypothetical protein